MLAATCLTIGIGNYFKVGGGARFEVKVYKMSATGRRCPE